MAESIGQLVNPSIGRGAKAKGRGAAAKRSAECRVPSAEGQRTESRELRVESGEQGAAEALGSRGARERG
jgi:hypothetical protein